jgi:transcriptional regulator with XRE-family HTH domain
VGVLISSAQSKAARALLGWTQSQLAERSGVSLRTVANFEGGEHQPIPSIQAALERALQEAGIIFLDQDRAGGLGVRLAKRRRSR